MNLFNMFKKKKYPILSKNKKLLITEHGIRSATPILPAINTHSNIINSLDDLFITVKNFILFLEKNKIKNYDISFINNEINFYFDKDNTVLDLGFSLKDQTLSFYSNLDNEYFQDDFKSKDFKNNQQLKELLLKFK